MELLEWLSTKMSSLPIFFIRPIDSLKLSFNLFVSRFKHAVLSPTLGGWSFTAMLGPFFMLDWLSDLSEGLVDGGIDTFCAEFCID